MISVILPCSVILLALVIYLIMLNQNDIKEGSLSCGILKLKFKKTKDKPEDASVKKSADKSKNKPPKKNT